MIVTLDIPDETNAMTVTLIATSVTHTNIETFGTDLQKYNTAKATLRRDEGFDVTISSETKWEVMPNDRSKRVSNATKPRGRGG